MQLFQEYNARCQSPWTQPRLNYKMNEALTYPHEKERGHLLTEEREKNYGVDLSEFHVIREENDEPGEESDVDEPLIEVPPIPPELLRVPGFVGECIIVQTGRIHGSIKTELDALLSIFEQRYFADEKGHLKQYPLPVKSAEMCHLTKTLIGIAASPEGRREMDAEEAVRRLVEGDGDEEVQKIRRELKKKDKVITENKKALAAKDKALTEKDKQIAEFKAKLSSHKSK